jgi:site-specific recombinase XerD
MKLSAATDAFITFRRGLGMTCVEPARILKAFCKAIGDSDLSQIDPVAVSTFIAGKGPITGHWHRKFYVLNVFYKFVVGRGYAASAPLPQIIPKAPQPLTPFIYTEEQLMQLVAATDRLRETCDRQVSRAAMRMIILLLYGAALRISEALSLTVRDVDLSASLLTIRQSKFNKSRLVPIGPRLTSELAAYALRERRSERRHGANSLYFAKRNGNALRKLTVNYNFRRLCALAGVRRLDPGRYGPRLHDLRHSSAVHRLTAWYREGKDVNRLLPQLSTYLGHLSIHGTQRYLTMTAELLQEASRRFEQYALPKGAL